MTRSPSSIRNITIVGGGTAGWMSAAALSNGLKGLNIGITLIESEEIGTIGVGEATIPPIHAFNNLLGINQADFMRACNATFKLGIEFKDWGEKNQSYIHPFGDYGRDKHYLTFHQMWLRYAMKQRSRGESCSIEDYSIACTAARQRRFAHPASDHDIGVALWGYAFHFDAGLYARYLRRYAEARGVVRIEGKVAMATRKGSNGHIDKVVMEDGRQIDGDFFLDCSGLHGLLIGQTLGVAYEDWRAWLPCDRAVAVQCGNVEAPIPYTRSTADDAGWRWRIPLQNRVGNGYVYSSPFLSDDAAEARLLTTLDGPPLTAPRRIRFTPGMRKSFWVGNCLAVGLSAGFLEPLESTSIQFIQSTILRFLGFFPTRDSNPTEIKEFNNLTENEYIQVRDFIMLHYKATVRDDTPFWRHCRDLEAPSTLIQRMELFKSRGRLSIPRDSQFASPSWLAVMVGQGLIPEHYDPLADRISETELDEYMAHVKATVARTVEAMSSHADYIRNFCPTEVPA